MVLYEFFLMQAAACWLYHDFWSRTTTGAVIKISTLNVSISFIIVCGG